MQKQKIIQQIKRHLHILRDIENDKLYHIVTETCQEITHFDSAKFPKAIVENDIVEKYKTTYNRILRGIKKENEFILPYIDKVLDKINTDDKDVFMIYANLTIPLKNYLIEQSKIMDMLGELKNICFSYTLNSYCGNLLLSIVEISQLFEKHIFMLQHLIIPELVKLVELNDLTVKTINTQNDYVRV